MQTSLHILSRDSYCKKGITTYFTSIHAVYLLCYFVKSKCSENFTVILLLEHFHTFGESVSKCLMASLSNELRKFWAPIATSQRHALESILEGLFTLMIFRLEPKKMESIGTSNWVFTKQKWTLAHVNFNG